MVFAQSVFFFVVTLGVLITFHELGHYVIARFSGVKVVRFSIGFGRPIWTWLDRRGTEFCVAAIPLGGYVRMLDERDPDPIGKLLPGDVSYNVLSPWWRIAIALGGPFANFLLAIVCYWVMFVVGFQALLPVIGAPAAGTPAAAAGLAPGAEIIAVDGRAVQSWSDINLALADRLGESGAITIRTRDADRGASGASQQSGREHSVPIREWLTGEAEPDMLRDLGLMPTIAPMIGEVIAGDVADQAGLRANDLVVSVDGEPVNDWRFLVTRIQGAVDQPLQLTVRRDRQTVDLTLTPRTRDGGSVGAIGVRVAQPERRVAYGPLAALPLAMNKTWRDISMTLGFVQKIVTGLVSSRNLSGPITIAQVARESASAGWDYYVGVLALLSISLGVLNLLPIPVLDGGHVLFCSAELVLRRPLSERVQVVGMQIGLAMVAGLMMLAIFNDIVRLL